MPKKSELAEMAAVYLRLTNGARIHMTDAAFEYWPKHARKSVRVTWFQIDRIMTQIRDEENGA